MTTMTVREVQAILDRKNTGTYERATAFAIVEKASLIMEAFDAPISPACDQLLRLAWACDEQAETVATTARAIGASLIRFSETFEAKGSARFVDEVPGRASIADLVQARERLAGNREAFKAVAGLALTAGSPVLAALGERLRLRPAIEAEAGK
jgi:hypothetical protein